MHIEREAERHAISLYGRKIINSFGTSKAKEILRKAPHVTEDKL